MILAQVVRFVGLRLLLVVIFVAKHLLFELLFCRWAQREGGHVTNRAVLSIPSAPTVESLDRLGLGRKKWPINWIPTFPGRGSLIFVLLLSRLKRFHTKLPHAEASLLLPFLFVELVSLLDFGRRLDLGHAALFVDGWWRWVLLLVFFIRARQKSVSIDHEVVDNGLALFTLNQVLFWFFEPHSLFGGRVFSLIVLSGLFFLLKLVRPWRS